MAQFANDTRTWLEKLIKQRRVLLRTGHSHKPLSNVLQALHVLELQLSAYSYQNDLYMARFIRQQSENIETILPGTGSTHFQRRHSEFRNISVKSISIIDAAKTKLNEKVN